MLALERAVTDAELRTAALEAAAGAGLAPRDALAERDELRRDGRILDLADGRMTTARVRAAEQDIDRRLVRMAADPAQAIETGTRERGIRTKASRQRREDAPARRPRSARAPDRRRRSL